MSIVDLYGDQIVGRITFAPDARPLSPDTLSSAATGTPVRRWWPSR
jgi:hypothetical protein